MSIKNIPFSHEDEMKEKILELVLDNHLVGYEIGQDDIYSYAGTKRKVILKLEIIMDDKPSKTKV